MTDDTSEPGTENPAPDREPPEGLVNGEITDAVADANKAADQGAASLREASLAQVIAQSFGLAMLNAASTQQNAQIAASATVLATVNRILQPFVERTGH